MSLNFLSFILEKCIMEGAEVFVFVFKRERERQTEDETASEEIQRDDDDASDAFLLKERS